MNKYIYIWLEHTDEETGETSPYTVIMSGHEEKFTIMDETGYDVTGYIEVIADGRRENSFTVFSEKEWDDYIHHAYIEKQKHYNSMQYGNEVSNI